MTRRLAAGGPWEQPVGYSRAVAAGDFVFVSGCTSVADGHVVHEGDAYGQTAQAIANVAPTTSMIGIGALIDSRLLVEVEAVAYQRGIGGP